MAGRFNGITDLEWAEIESLLPKKQTRMGRPYANLRYVINSILFMLIEGSRWGSIPRGKIWAPKSTAYGWLKKMVALGTLDQVFSAIVKKADHKNMVCWKDVLFDGTFSPGKGGGKKVEYGYKGKGSTIHMMADSNGMPLNAVVTAANGDERRQVVPLLYGTHIKKDGSIENAHLDKGFDANFLRKDIVSFGICPIIPYRKFKNRLRKICFPTKSNLRWKIERSFSWIKSKFRRIATRWERKSDIWKGFILLAMTMMWVQKLVFG